MKFRSDIEGLRAIAVVLVVAYHFLPAVVSGGYIGVDVFFVISGYIITGSLLASGLGEASAGPVLLAFWARRARRLLPNALLALLAVAVAALLCRSDALLYGVGRDMSWASLYAVNWRFSRIAVDYLQSGHAASSLVLNYWSLAVEEQFYLFWPIALLGALNIGVRTGDTSRRRTLLLAVCAAAISFAWCISLSGERLTVAFFSPLARTWQLLVGAVIALAEFPRAVVHDGTAVRGVRLAAALTWLGVLVIGASAVTFTQDTRHPGAVTVVPVLGTVLAIAFGAAAPNSALARLLATRPLQYLGNRSYSIYLWHWPVLALGRTIVADHPVIGTLGLLAISLVVAEAACRWIEHPLRFRVGRGIPASRVLLVALASSGLVAMIGVTVTEIADRGLRQLIARRVGLSAPEMQLPDWRLVRDDLPSTYADGCHLSLEAVDQPECAYGGRGSPASAILFGDSHAAQWFPGLRIAAEQKGVVLYAWTKSSCPWADVTVWNRAIRGRYVECDAWRERRLVHIAAIRPGAVFVANLIEDGTVLVDRTTGASLHGPAAAAEFAAGMTRTLQRLRAAGVTVVVLRDTPRQRPDMADCLYRARTAASCAMARTMATSASPLDMVVARSMRVPIWDLTDRICTPTTCPIALPDGRLVMYRDPDHLSATFVKTLAPDLMRLWMSLPSPPYSVQPLRE